MNGSSLLQLFLLFNVEINDIYVQLPTITSSRPTSLNSFDFLLNLALYFLNDAFSKIVYEVNYTFFNFVLKQITPNSVDHSNSKAKQKRSLLTVLLPRK